MVGSYGEWEVIKKGNPRFEGHYQPRQPLWGYEMDNDPKVVEKWINVATNYGVNVFVYDWYWYEEGPYLESALNDGFLKAKNNSKMQFLLEEILPLVAEKFHLKLSNKGNDRCIGGAAVAVFLLSIQHGNDLMLLAGYIA